MNLTQKQKNWLNFSKSRSTLALVKINKLEMKKFKSFETKQIKTSIATLRKN